MACSLDASSSPGQEKGWIPFMCAAEAGNIHTVTEILANGCDIDIDARDYDGCTSLALAAQKGHTEVVERLLAHGANPNLSDLDQITPLWKAAQYGHTAVVKLLLASEKLLDVNPRPAYLNKNKLDTPLSIAIKQGHQKTAELLSRADGINPCLTTRLPRQNYRENVSILSLAIRCGFEDVALSLLDKCDTGHESQDAENNVTKDTVEPASKLLVFAVATGCSSIVRELLTRHDTDVNAVHAYYAGKVPGWVEDSPLMAASRRGDLSTVRLLLDMDKIRPDVGSKRSGTAITAAAQGGFTDVVKTLIADGRIEVGCENRDGRNALSFAAESGSEGVVDELLATGGVDPNGRDSGARTPLIWTVDPGPGYGPGGWEAHEGVVRRLLTDSKIAVNAADSKGCTALFYAAKNGAIGLVMALLEHPQIDSTAGPEVKSPLAAALFGHADVVHALLSIGRVDANSIVIQADQRTALMYVAQFGGVEHESAARVLLSFPGIDANFQDNFGLTALMLAALQGTIGMVKLILTFGGNPNLQDHRGNTALRHARNVEILKAILDHPGIKPDLPNNEGRTALSLAAEHGKIESVNALLTRDDVDPNARDIHGRGPLSWIFGENGVQDSEKKEEQKAVLQQLLRIPDVDPNAEDQNGLTPLLLAIMSHQGHEYVEILLSRSDLDVNWPRSEGIGNPLDTAKEVCNMETIGLLRTRGATESVNSTRPRPHSFEANFVVEEGISRDVYSIFEEARPQRRQRQRACRSSSQERGVSSDESDFDYQPIMTGSLIRIMRKGLLKEYPLYLGDQQEYANEWVDSTTSMCSSCSAMDLGSSFWRRHTQYEGRVVANLGRVDDTWKKRSCPLCRLYATVYPRTRLEEGHKLASFSTTQSWLCHASMRRWENFRFKRFADTMLLAVVADIAVEAVPTRPRSRRNPSPSRRDKHVVKTAISSGLIGRLGRNGPAQGSVTIPRLATEINDWGVARGWISLCRENHSGECNPRNAATIPHFFLVECSTRQVIEHKDSQRGGPPPYLALSYVWGQAQGSQKPLQRQKQQESLDGKGDIIVEPAIEDAIRVTLELGYRYLWVDRYCIVQTGDEAVKQDQLRHMHLVYANAEVTLIAAAGKDSSAGLPGVPGRPRNPQPGALIQGHALVCIPPDPSIHISSRSTWATRGWTFQEGLLARRRLFFSEYEMSYECRNMLCREAIRLPRGFEQHMSGHKPRFMEPFWMYQPYKLPGMDSSQTGIGIFDLLAAYTKRKLSLPSDTLNAMLGIFSLLGQHKTRPIYHICGVPILRLTDHRPDIYERVQRKPTEPGDNGDTDIATTISLRGFLDGLCWRLEEPAHRRQGFPSWSWTGWQGVVAAMSKHSYAIKQPHGFAINISIIPENQDGGVAVPWSRCYDSLRMVDDSNADIRSGQNHVLEITASAVTVRLRVGDYDGRPNTWIGTVCASHGVWQGEFSLTSKDVPISSLLQDSWSGIVLGNSESQNYTNLHDTTVVVIQEQKHKQEGANAKDCTYCERVGLLRLVHCTFELSMLDQKIWRLR